MRAGWLAQRGCPESVVWTPNVERERGVWAEEKSVGSERLLWAGSRGRWETAEDGVEQMERGRESASRTVLGPLCGAPAGSLMARFDEEGAFTAQDDDPHLDRYFTSI